MKLRALCFATASGHLPLRNDPAKDDDANSFHGHHLLRLANLYRKVEQVTQVSEPSLQRVDCAQSFRLRVDLLPLEHLQAGHARRVRLARAS
eukprot:6200309-Pleurochrysis_carterae.AAC.1